MAASPRPKELPYTPINSYGHVLYGLRFLFQLWPLWVVVLFSGALGSWWLNLSQSLPTAIAGVLLWLTPFVKPVAIILLVIVANKLKKWNLASWNTVDAAMVALIVTLVTTTIQYAGAAGLFGGTVDLSSPVVVQTILLIVLSAGLLLSGIKMPIDTWFGDLVRPDPVADDTPQIKGTVQAPPPPQIRDVDPARLEESLGKRVIGQDLIARQLSKAVARRLAQQRRGKPVFTGLFAGPTGVGKTEMAKALSESLMGSEKILFRVDCGNILGEAGLQTLVGAPTGYMGSDKPGALTAHVQRFPNSVLLFDEIEKAGGAQGQQSPLFRLLLSLLDEGRFTEQSTGQAIDATGCVILMTSNAAHKSLGKIYEQHKDDPAALTRATKDELQSTFSPEFLARIDLVTSFSPLDADARAKVIAQHVGRIARQYDVTVKTIDAGLISRALVQWQALENYGAREVLRWLEDTISDPLIGAKKQGLKAVNLLWQDESVQARPAAAKG